MNTHLKFVLRLLKKDGAYSLLNILSLSMAITVSIILFLYLQNELGYDKSFKKADRIFRLTHRLKAKGADFNTARTARPLGPLIADDFPEIKAFLRINPWGRTLVETTISGKENARFYEEKLVEADSNLFRFFDHEFLAGNPQTCLKGPGKIVLTETVARKYFADQPAVGQTLLLDGTDRRQVTAVVSDLPPNVHLKYEMIISGMEPEWMETEALESGNKTRYSEVFWNPGLYTYFLLPEKYPKEEFENKFPVIYDKYFKPFGDNIGGSVDVDLQPLTKIHFHSNLDRDEPKGNLDFLYTFLVIGIVLILLACINYVNLVTARSVYRVEEIGMRKVLGVTSAKLFIQLLSEAVVLSFISMVIALGMTAVVLELTSFNSWIDKDLSLNLVENTNLLLSVLGISLLIGLVSGLYPAVYIPTVKIVPALKGAFKNQEKGVLLRKTLIVLQFVVSIFVIITTVLMGLQIDFMKQADLGFDRDNIVVVDAGERDLLSRYDVLKNKLLSHPDIEGVTTAYEVPGVMMGGQVFKVQTGSNGEFAQQSMFTINPGEDYISTMGYEILAGRDFLPGKAEARKSIIVNEAGAKSLGWNENTLGKKVKYFHGQQEMQVVGVVKDFHFESLHKAVEPLFIVANNEEGSAIQVRINSRSVPETLEHIKNTMQEMDPDSPFNYFFLDQEFDKQYKQDQVQQNLISMLSYICTLISILGLVGLSAFTVGQKSKEISIRKTLGGTTSHILLLFSRDYVKLILLAIIIAIPFSYYVIVEWQSAFAYQMPLAWWYFILPGLLILVIGVVTVLVQTLKAATRDPVNGLRSE